MKVSAEVMNRMPYSYDPFNPNDSWEMEGSLRVFVVNIRQVSIGSAKNILENLLKFADDPRKFNVFINAEDSSEGMFAPEIVKYRGEMRALLENIKIQQTHKHSKDHLQIKWASDRNFTQPMHYWFLDGMLQTIVHTFSGLEGVKGSEIDVFCTGSSQE